MIIDFYRNHLLTGSIRKISRYIYIFSKATFHLYIENSAFDFPIRFFLYKKPILKNDTKHAFVQIDYGYFSVLNSKNNDPNNE